ncbi:NUDIX hydrolase [Candidatus Campbellbacteria bacterium]|nr:MAG: NUDIX hydrolase [Candidatus Campbellbacteria bacterium]
MTPNSPHVKFAILASDTAIFTVRDGELLVRLVNVDRPPHFKNIPGLPGGLLTPKETADEAALRHIEEKAHIKASKLYIEQLYTFSAVHRDPRGRVVAVAHTALIPWENLSATEQMDTNGAQWVSVSSAHKLAYDHDEVLTVAVNRLRSRSTYTTIVSKLMPAEFTLSELEKTYESILKTQFDKRNFRKKILKLKILKELPHKRTGVAFRPAALYTFASPKVKEIEIL